MHKFTRSLETEFLRAPSESKIEHKYELVLNGFSADLSDDALSQVSPMSCRPITFAMLSFYDPSTRQASADERRRQVKHFTHLVKNVKIADFHYHIRNDHEKCM